MNIQEIIIILLFIGASVFVGIRIFRSITAKNDAGCAQCGNKQEQGKD